MDCTDREKSFCTFVLVDTRGLALLRGTAFEADVEAVTTVGGSRQPPRP
jgi:hypothetical protein